MNLLTIVFRPGSNSIEIFGQVIFPELQQIYFLKFQLIVSYLLSEFIEEHSSN